MSQIDEPLVTHEDLSLARREHGGYSTEYTRLLRTYVRQQRELGNLDKSNRVRNPRPPQTVVLRRTERERREQVEAALAEGDVARVREIAMETIAQQLVDKDPKIKRDAAKALLNDIRIEDEDVRLIEYITPAAPGYAEFPHGPPVDRYLPEPDAVEVTTSTD